MVAGTIGALGAGVLVPLTTQSFALFIGAFAQPDPRAALARAAFLYLAYAAAALLAFSLQTGAWALTGQRQAEKWRMRFLAAALRQDVGFFDMGAVSGGGAAALSLALAEDCATLQAGMGEKIGLATSDLTMFVTGYLLAFTKSWSMTLVLLASVPLIAGAAALLAKAVASSSARTSAAYSTASSIATQAIANVRTLAAAGAERRAVEAYSEALEAPRRVGEVQGVMSGLAFGWFQLAIHAGAYASALYFAATEIAKGRLTGADAVGVMFSALIGGMALGQLGPNLQAPMRARTAAANLLRVIERKPDDGGDEAREREAKSSSSIIPATIAGEFVFRDVVFAYPTAPDRRALDGFSLVVPAGKTVALVGQSGSGKSTVVQLCERFYNPQQGQILLDGVDVRRLDLRWLRSVTSLVSQEPVLFQTTIYENIAVGLAAAARGRKGPAATGDVESASAASDNENDDEPHQVIRAAKAANAHAFIMRLPDGYLTNVGERGLTLSGGQRQRVAIARAVLRQPRLLLLDEATAALDTASERKVQAALDAAARGRTTITIAHRLSTVRRADAIAVVGEGRVVECGPHEELAVKRGGAYAALLSLHAAADAAAEAQVRGGGGSAAAAKQAEEDAEHLASSAATAAEAAALRQQLLQAAAAADGDGDGQKKSNGGLFAARRRRAAASRDPSAPALGSSLPCPESAVSLSAPTMAAENSNINDANEEARLLLERRRQEEQAAACPPTPGRWAALKRLGRLNAPELPYGAVGALGSLCAGAIQPAFALAFSALIASYYLPDTAQMLRDARFYALIFALIGFGGFVSLLLQQACFGVMGQRLAARVRVLLLASILRQEQAFFELPSSSTGELSARLSADASAIRGACADVVGVALQQTGTVLCGYGIALYYDWRMALVVTASLPVITAAFALQTQFRLDAAGGGGGGGKEGSGGAGSSSSSNNSNPPKGKSRASKAAKSIGRSNAIAADAFSSVRVVHAYGLERFVSEQYASAYAPAAASARRAALAMGLSWGMAQAVQWCVFAGLIFFAGDEIFSGRATYQQTITAFMAVFFVAIGLSEAMNGFSNVGAALPAAGRVFSVVDRRSAIDPLAPPLLEGEDEEGMEEEGGDGKKQAAAAKRRHRHLEREAVRLLRWGNRAGGARRENNQQQPPQQQPPSPAAASSDDAVVAIDAAALHLLPAAARLGGPASVELRAVVFRYPSRPTALVFDGFSLSVAPGKTQALVGESGSGKSTVIQLLLRFYDPEQGAVLLDGVDVRHWPSVKDVRAQIGLVSQEPVLFNASLLDNLRLARPDAPMAEVLSAAKAAHVDEFVAGLPEGYDSKLGEGGVQLSGGQRQRVAIARALLKKPRLLLLDEATAALDNKSERVVQLALEEASAGRTTVVVAHRLQTVRRADSIAVVHRGRVLERGTHEELLALGSGGAYVKLVQASGGAA
jgi:ATP-binding cassette, subfamily B (MDR/TAP), member 1